MTGETREPRARTQEEVMAARRAAMLRFAIQQQEAKHYAVALDMYRQLIEEYPGTEEENEARARMLDLACLFGSENQTHRMLSVYDTLETMYAPRSAQRAVEARRARVKQILEEVHEQDRQEAEARARIEATREGLALTSEPTRLRLRRRKPEREPQGDAIGRQGGADVA
jgi:sugar diacid utilization regulator